MYLWISILLPYSYFLLLAYPIKIDIEAETSSDRYSSKLHNII